MLNERVNTRGNNYKLLNHTFHYDLIYVNTFFCTYCKRTHGCALGCSLRMHKSSRSRFLWNFSSRNLRKTSHQRHDGGPFAHGSLAKSQYTYCSCSTADLLANVHTCGVLRSASTRVLNSPQQHSARVRAFVIR